MRYERYKRIGVMVLLGLFYLSLLSFHTIYANVETSPTETVDEDDLTEDEKIKRKSVIFDPYEIDLNLGNISSKYISVAKFNDDTQEYELIYSKDGENLIYPASMTKIWSGYLAFEKIKDRLDEEVSIIDDDFKNYFEINASRAGFWSTEVLPIRDLVYGGITASGAEALRALARISVSSEDELVKLMNQEAKRIGVNNSSFENAAGLHDPKHYSTTNDMALLVSETLKDPAFTEVLSTVVYTTKSTPQNPGGLRLENLFMGTIDFWIRQGEMKASYIQGGKTGWTPEAQNCLATFSDLNGIKFVVVTAMSEDDLLRIKDHENIYFQLMGQTHSVAIFDPKEHITSLSITRYDGAKHISIDERAKPITLQLPKGVEREDLRYVNNFPSSVEAPLKVGDKLGDVKVYLGSELVYDRQHFATQDYRKRSLWTSGSLRIIVLVIFALAVYFIVYLQIQYLKLIRNLQQFKKTQNIEHEKRSHP